MAGAMRGLVGFAPPPDKWGTAEDPTRLHPSQGVIPEVLGTFVVAVGMTRSICGSGWRSITTRSRRSF